MATIRSCLVIGAQVTYRGVDGTIVGIVPQGSPRAGWCIVDFSDRTLRLPRCSLELAEGAPDLFAEWARHLSRVSTGEQA